MNCGSFHLFPSSNYSATAGGGQSATPHHVLTLLTVFLQLSMHLGTGATYRSMMKVREGEEG